MNKLGSMLVHPVIKQVLIENNEEVSLRKVMYDKKKNIVNLSKGQIGADASHIFGPLFITSIASTSLSRVDTEEEERIPFIVYVDEFHNLTILSLIGMFSELRKFKVGMTMAHQYMDQFNPDIKSAELGNIDTIITFRLGT
ncbi:MAG: hypothetical protein IPO62_17930 [Saprospiraceae bacterium]|nr:hypothetical protein [Saprospiraceae bacterium]